MKKSSRVFYITKSDEVARRPPGIVHRSEKEGNHVTQTDITFNIDSTLLDEVLEKANRLVELLREIQQIINFIKGGDAT